MILAGFGWQISRCLDIFMGKLLFLYLRALTTLQSGLSWKISGGIKGIGGSCPSLSSANQIGKPPV
jgi:hypothetical protein